MLEVDVDVRVGDMLEVDVDVRVGDMLEINVDVRVCRLIDLFGILGNSNPNGEGRK